jgi:hypothetical protein
MITLNQNDVALLLKLDETVQDLACVGTLVDEIAQEYQLVIHLGCYRIEERVERMNAAMYIADGNQAASLFLGLHLHV